MTGSKVAFKRGNQPIAVATHDGALATAADWLFRKRPSLMGGCRSVALERYADTYNGHPLWYVALASEKSYLSLHLMSVYAGGQPLERLKTGFKAAGKTLDMGKSCVHFQRAEDLPLDVIGQIVASVPVEKWVAIAQAARKKSSG